MLVLSQQRRVLFQSADLLQPRRVEWLWSGWLAKGKFHILAGAPGEGKTTIAISLAAAVSSGGNFPDGTKAEESKVIIWSGEDDPQDTLLPRLLAAGANPSNCIFVKGVSDESAFNPAADLPILRNAIADIGSVGLIIFDPIVSLISGDSHKNAEVRKSLDPVVNLAHEVNAAVLGISHFGKSNEVKSLAMKVIGSVAFTAVARAVLVVGPRVNGSNDNEKLLLLAKSNLSKDKCGVSYTISETEIQEGITSSFIRWQDIVMNGEAQFLEGSCAETDTPSVLRRAEDFLIDFLSEGPKSHASVHEHAEKEGIGSRTLRRASETIGILKLKHSDHWQWSLP